MDVRRIAAEWQYKGNVMSPELSEIIKGIDYEVQNVHRLKSFKHEVWDLQCANGIHLIAKSGMAMIDWPYGEVTEVENEIRTSQVLSRVVPRVVPPLVSSGVLETGSWYIIRHAVPDIYNTEAANGWGDFGDKLVGLLQTITAVEVGNALRKEAFMPNCNLQAEVTCLINQLLPFASEKTASLLGQIEKVTLNLLSSLDTASENVVCIGNFTPGNIGTFSDGRPGLIDCSVFRWGSRLYDLTKLCTYLELQARNSIYPLPSLGMSSALKELKQLQASEKHGEALMRVLRMRHGLSWMARDEHRITTTYGMQILRMFD